MTRFAHPGVYVDEFSPAKRIEGVSTFVLGVLIGVAAAMAIDRLRGRWRRHSMPRARQMSG